MILYNGKMKDMTFKELWMMWNFGRTVEKLEAGDFNLN